MYTYALQATTCLPGEYTIIPRQCCDEETIFFCVSQKILAFIRSVMRLCGRWKIGSNLHLLLLNGANAFVRFARRRVFVFNSDSGWLLCVICCFVVCICILWRVGIVVFGAGKVVCAENAPNHRHTIIVASEYFPQPILWGFCVSEVCLSLSLICVCLCIRFGFTLNFRTYTIRRSDCAGAKRICVFTSAFIFAFRL